MQNYVINIMGSPVLLEIVEAQLALGPQSDLATVGWHFRMDMCPLVYHKTSMPSGRGLVLHPQSCYLASFSRHLSVWSPYEQ